MRVELQNTKQDYIESFKIQLRNNFQRRIVALTILLFCVVAVVCGDHFTWIKCILAIVAYAIFVLAVMYFIPLCKATNNLRKLILKEGGFIGKRQIVITDEGLLSEGQDYSLLRNWQSIKAIDINQKYIYIGLIDKTYLIIPKRFFPTDIEAANFMALISSKTQLTNKFYTLSKTSTPKPPYLLGLLGVVPLVGAFVGIALILYGIFKYKDKWLVLIGIGSIAFTVAVYGTLFYVGFKSDFGKGQFAQISKMELNTLVKQVEFYKIQNGLYPDSLQQLQEKDEFINIHDPLMNNRKNDLYNYHRVGNKYTLFSSGIDGIPNTSDDIYPSIKIDTNKMGLIIKR